LVLYKGLYLRYKYPHVCAEKKGTFFFSRQDIYGISDEGSCGEPGRGIYREPEQETCGKPGRGIYREPGQETCGKPGRGIYREPENRAGNAPA
jgi:hypothetical protein